MRQKLAGTIVPSLMLALLVPPTAEAAPAPPQPTTSSHRAVLDRYCVTCHNERLRTANLALDTADIEDVAARPDVWEKVVRKLRSGAMPPVGRPRPETATVQALVSWLEGSLDRAGAANPNPGRAAVHRLNRAEYTNVMRDLLALDIDGRALLPADESAHGFDNIADALAVSPGLLERYLAAATRIARLAIGDATLRPVTQTYSARPGLVQDDRMGEEMAFGSRGGIVVRHHFPLDGEYVLKIRLQRTWMDEIRGLDRPHQIDVRIDRARVKVFTVGGRFESPGAGGQGRGGRGDDQEERKQYEMTADEGLEVRFPVKAGTRLVGVAFEKNFAAAEGVLRPRPSVVSFSYRGMKDVDPGIESFQISGPFAGQTPEDTPSRRRIFVCYPGRPADETPCARRILGGLARRAFRRPVASDDLEALLSFYEEGRRKQGFDAGIALALERLLVDPDFLFRVERDEPGVKAGAVHPVGDVELASRLSFFLWSSIPDDELLNLAERGRLSEPAVLERQVRRMLADERATALVKNFASQWLYLRNMRLVLPDPEAFPEFDDNLREAFQRETELFVESVLRDDRSVLDLLRADYTFLNERLARHYRIPNVYGSHFRRVTFPDDRRGGLLGQGSLLTVTSYAHRTSPVTRGKWLLENILGAPPPPPPPDVPALKENEATSEPHSVRERMEQHRRNPVCASCHARMDPLGFALENFDAIGRWRDSDSSLPIDATGTLPDGTAFDGPAGLRRALVEHGDEFAMTVTEKMLTYALGRGLEPSDGPSLRAIAREAAKADYRWSSLVLAIARSVPFQMKRSRLP
jgi:hypothetical protein